MTSSSAPNHTPNPPSQSSCGQSGPQQSVSSPMATSPSPGANSSSPMGSDFNDVPGHRTDQPATGRSIFDPETGTCTPAPRRRGLITEFLSTDPPRAFSGWAPLYVGGGSMDYEVDDEEDWDEDWEEDDESGIPASFLWEWDSGTGQEQGDSEYWGEGEETSDDDEEQEVDSEGEALPRAPAAKRSQK